VRRPPLANRTESQRILGEVRRRAVSESLEDDFALATFTFL
jgi:hypothetical protein